VSIWRKQGERGEFYTANVQRAYTNDDGKSWEYSDSFGRDETLSAAELLRLAWIWIVKAEAQAKVQND
jgi:hypothetical protein